jgi:Peptidase family S41
MRAISITFSSFAIIFCVAVTAASGARTDAAGDIRSLVAELELRHPNAYHSVSREDLHRAADDLAARAPSLRRDQLIVGVMRLTAMLGERDGHSGVFPLSPVPGQSLRAYPLRLHRFPDGLYVARADDPSLVGARVTAVGGLSVDEVEARVRPLISRDNDWTILDRLPFFVVTAEVLGGLDIAPTFSFAVRGGGARDVSLQPISAAEHIRRFGGWWQPTIRVGRQPLYLRRRGIEYGVMTINRGRALYVTYNVVAYPGSMPQRLLRLARKPRVRRVVVDLRINGGGNNTTYGTLLRALQSPRINRRGKLAVLIGRRTFSAAGNFAADVDARTRARFFGESTGGAPSQWGDQAVIPMPSLEISAATAVEYVGDPDDTRTATLPDVPVSVSAADFFGGRDPVLAAALR